MLFYGSSSCTSSCSPSPLFDFDAFDANGVSNCSGTPKVCQPLWTGHTASPESGSPAIANGKVYAGGGNVQAWVLPPPTITTIKPSNGNTVSGNQGLDAIASSGVTQVQYEISGGPSNLTDSVIATVSKPSLYGWTASWNSTIVPNGTYTLQSVASYGGEVSGTGAPIAVTVSN